MFDYVNFKMNCPKCGNEGLKFQTKSSYCLLEIVDPIAVDDFYSVCDCGNWIEFSRDNLPAREKARAEPYTIDEVTALGFTMDNGL